MLASLIEALDWLPRNFGELGSKAEHLLPDRYYSPGFIAALAAYLCHKQVGQECLTYASEDNKGYLAAVGLSKALWGVDDYKFERRNAGVNYAPLTPLASQDAVDEATTQINGCLRAYASQGHMDYSKSPAFKDLTHVVGELHDNVWSHGMHTGFSTAQRRNLNDEDHIIEFSLADCGVGFLDELRRSGIPGVETHRQAIEWCVQEGNSSKLAAKEDEWAQSVPDEHVGDVPFGRIPTRSAGNGNHHQGLGLAKLVELAQKYKGVLYLASGNCVMRMQHDGAITYRPLQKAWKGVAISLSIKESSFMSARVGEAEDVVIDDIMNLLRG